MYNYENEYREPEFENNYEFNPQSESSFGMQNFQNESGNGNEYETNPDFEMEGDYEYEKEFFRVTDYCIDTFKRAACSLLHVRTDEDYVKVLQRFFISRNK